MVIAYVTMDDTCHHFGYQYQTIRSKSEEQNGINMRMIERQKTSSSTYKPIFPHHNSFFLTTNYNPLSLPFKMHFTTVSAAALIAAVATVQAAPTGLGDVTSGLSGATGGLSGVTDLLTNIPGASSLTDLADLDIIKTLTGVVTQCKSNGAAKDATTAGTSVSSSVPKSAEGAKGIVQSLVESLYPGLSKTTSEVDKIVAQVLGALGADKLSQDVLVDSLSTVDALTEKLGLGVGCLVEVIRKAVEEVVGAAKAQKLALPLDQLD